MDALELVATALVVGLLLLFGVRCARWARATNRNPRAWFLAGVFFNIYTAAAILYLESAQRHGWPPLSQRWRLGHRSGVAARFLAYAPPLPVSLLTAAGHQVPVFALCWLGLLAGLLVLFLGEPSRTEAIAITLLQWFYFFVLVLPVLATD